MFDLFRSRAKVVRYMLGAILLVVALSMVVTLIPGFVGASFSGDSNVVAEIGNEALTYLEVQQQLQSQLRNNEFPREMMGNYVPLIINQMITNRAVAYQARRMGFEVTDAEVAEAVQSMIPALFPNGQYVGDEVYAQYLSRMHYTIPQFEANVRTQILLLRLMNLALEGEIVTDSEVEEEFRRLNEKISIEYVAVSSQSYRSEVNVNQVEIEEFFDQNRDTFRIGEKRDAAILVVDQGKLAESVEVPEEQLRQAYAAQTDRFRTGERVKARHILLMTMNKSPEEVEQAKARAEELLAELKGGADFAELARENSEDTGTAPEGGDLGWIQRGQTVTAFENAAFSLEPNTLSDIITTEYGFHIIEVLEKEPARLQPFEEVRDELAEEQKRQYVVEQVQELADQARAALTEDPSHPREVADKLGLTVYSLSKIGAGDPVPELAANPQALDNLMALPANGVTQEFELGSDRLAVGVVTEVYPARPAELSEVQDDIRERLLTQKANEMAEQKRRLLTEQVAAGKNLDEIARATGLEIQKSNEFTRNGNVDRIGSAAYLGEAFDTEIGKIVGPLAALGQSVVCKVISKTPADMTQLAGQREELKTSLQRMRAQSRRELFADGILTTLIDEGKVKINERTIDRMVSAYSS
jgi:peptidyl-prolyl cis-trans isomerase D